MNASDLVEMLVALPDVATQRDFLDEQVPLLNDEVAGLLKQQADHLLRVDIHHSLNISDLLHHIAQLTQNPLYGALGLLVEANARSIGLGEFERAIRLYDEAAEIYGLSGCIAEQARSQVGKVNALSHLGRFAEALEIGQWAVPLLEKHEQWMPLITMTMNLGIVYGRRGEDLKSLKMFDRAAELYKQLGQDGISGWAMIQQNRSVALRNLGRFEESIAASQLSKDVLNQLGEIVEAARAQQGMALTYFVLGRFNEALDILDDVLTVFLDDGRMRDAILAQLYTTDCLLQLRRFPEVIEKCRYIRAGIGARQVEALAIINEAVAFAQLRRYEEALTSLSEARRIFIEAGNGVRVASTDLERAAVYLCQGRYDEGFILARECMTVFKANHLPIEEAQASIVSARAALVLKQYEEARQVLLDALQVGETLNIPTVRYQGHSLLGTLAHAQGDVKTAQKQFERAIEELEQLRGRLMIEFRVSFLEDKETIYQDMVQLCIEQGQLLRGLEFVERAKSRVLLDLLAYRLDLTIQARTPEDQPLVEELTELRSERDRLYRRWESAAESEDSNERGWSSSQSLRQKAQQDVLALEKQITDLWHRLLIHNAEYAREASLYTVRTESVQPDLDEDTLLVEYFTVHETPYAFLLTAHDVSVIRLEVNLKTIETLLQRLQLNLRAVPKSAPNQRAALAANAQALLAQLYDALLAPLEYQLTDYPKLLIVPHGILHYVPFHALHDGTSYLLEMHEIGYLPSASSLRYCREARPDSSVSLAIGNSQNGRLPYALDEARRISSILGCPLLDEEAATLAAFHRIAPDCKAIHLAAHGDFRPDNPLFSGLILANGWLTTMDIFNLRLKASLVTLSSCQTGRNVIGGGDELLGLMRAFLGAGAASLVLTLWRVEDRSTARLMELFYRKLADGRSKGAALREAQLQFIRGGSASDEEARDYAHPFFWAPFFLVGDTGPL
jgi:CHAT domain-containing protein